MANTKTRKRFKGYSIFEGETEKEYQSRLKKHRQFAGKDATLKRKDKIGVGGALRRVFKDVGEHLQENPEDIAWLAGGAGAARYVGGKAIKKLAKKGPEWSKKIRGEYGVTPSSRKFKSTDKGHTKGAKQRAEEQKGPYERVVTETKTKTTPTPGPTKRVKVLDKKGKPVRYTRGPNKGNIKYKEIAGKKIKKKTKYTEAGYESSWKGVAHAQKGKAFWGAVGVGMGASAYKKATAGGETTVGGATYEDKTTGSNLQKSTKKNKAWTTSGKPDPYFNEHLRRAKKDIRSDASKKRELSGRGMLKESINPATGGKLNGVSATDRKSKRNRELQDWVGDDHRQNARKTGGGSVTSNYTYKPDHRGTRVEKDTQRANVSGTSARLQRNGASKTKKTTKKKLHGSEIFRRRLGGMRGY